MSQRVIEWICNVCLNVFCVGWHQCCQMVDIYVYQIFQIWFIFKRAWYLNFWFGVYEKFRTFLSEVLVEILNQFIWFCYKTDKPIVVLKLYKNLVIFLNMGVNMHFGWGKSRLEDSWEVLKKTKLTSKHGLLVSQCIKMWESCVRECQTI